ERTDFTGLVRAGEWLARATALGLGPDVGPALDLAGHGEAIAGLPKRLRSNANALRNDMLVLTTLLDLDLLAAFGVEAVDEIPLKSLGERIEAWAASVDRYAEWAELS